MSIWGTNVLANRNIDRVIVLGSGPSVLDLTEEEKNYINRCKYVIAFNKFMAFYKKAGILPTHVYFHDRHDRSRTFFKYILQVCRKDRLENLTFFTNKEFAARTSLFAFFRFNKFRLERFLFNKSLGEKTEEWMGFYLKGLMRYPKKSVVHSIEITPSLIGGKWAESLNDKIFHYKGSITSVLNICSILFPYKDVFLVGTDFNSTSYFFEEELGRLEFEWKDHTYDSVKETGVHYSFQQTYGKTIDDKFPYVLKSMKTTHNTLYCINPNSLLIGLGVKYKALY